MEGWPSGQWQQTVNLSSQEFEGSNPSPSTIFFSDLAKSTSDTTSQKLSFSTYLQLCA